MPGAVGEKPARDRDFSLNAPAGWVSSSAWIRGRPAR